MMRGIQIRRLTFFLACMGGIFLACKARSHDIYQGVRSPAGVLCCGGDPVTGDCEGTHAFRVSRDGAVTFYSERYKATVTVPGDRIIWTQLDDPENRPLHWCGKPDASEPGGFRTICIFVAPPGT
jgi:hypothetical protein